MSNKDNQQPFLHETIKKEHVSRKSFRNQVLRVMLYGIIFGVFACFSFFGIRPWVEGMFQEDEVPPVITITPDDLEDDNHDEDIPPEENGEEDPDEDYPEQDYDNDYYADNEPEEIVIPELTAENYQEMMDSLLEIAMEANRSIVYIRGVSGEFHWIDEENFDGNIVTGLILYDTDNELLVIANNSLVDVYEAYRIMLSNDSSHPGELVMQDNNRNLAVFSIDKELLSDEDLEAIEPAILGNSNQPRQGDMVIAVGNFLGHGEGLAYGVVSSNRRHITLPDSRIRLLGTNIGVAPGGTGFLFNKRGEAIGLIMPGPWQGGGQTFANTLGVSDLRQAIVLMLKGERVPFLGIEGVTVTEEIAEALEMPRGIHVNRVELDSPAMNAGIQNGDIIVAFDGDYVDTIRAFHRAILESDVDSEVTIQVMRRGAEGYEEADFIVIIRSRE